MGREWKSELTPLTSRELWKLRSIEIIDVVGQEAGRTKYISPGFIYRFKLMFFNILYVWYSTH